MVVILGGVFEGGEDIIWIYFDFDFNDEIVFNFEYFNWILYKELLKVCKVKVNGYYYVGMFDLMEGLDVLVVLKGIDKVLLDIVM